MRLPALPLVANDPYFSVWCAADRLTDTDTTHWTGAVKRLRGQAVVDRAHYRFLGLGPEAAMETVSVTVTPTATRSVLRGGGVRLEIAFTTPLLLDDPELFSVPITMVDCTVSSEDGGPHKVALTLSVYDDLCFDGADRPAFSRAAFALGGLNIAQTGQKRQKLLCHAGDHITIDWGYLYLASHGSVTCEESRLEAAASLAVTPDRPEAFSALIGYDDVASINYFGVPTKAWYARHGKTLCDCLTAFDEAHDELLRRCARFDETLTAEAMERGGEDYALLCAAAYRQSIAAHKLIADEQGRMVLLSKENDSNGCTGTADVSYPSAPLFLKYNPELLYALCRPILRFARMPVWPFAYAPHDVGCYPQATGQVYGTNPACYPDGEPQNGDLRLNFYLFPAELNCYDEAMQMPVEECGNMVIMLCAAAGADPAISIPPEDMALLTQWADYLAQYGEDPANQLCTDDFAGHLARNVNLAAKAVVGMACFARLLTRQGDARADGYALQAQRMAASWLRRAQLLTRTALTFDGQGWSLKYNLAWDKALGLQLFSDSFYEKELESYLLHINPYGLPLDSRRDYAKSDWIVWVASLTDSPALFARLIAPLARYLRESDTRVPFGDWYDSKTGRSIQFVARSVQGGMWMPLLIRQK